MGGSVIWMEPGPFWIHTRAKPPVMVGVPGPGAELIALLPIITMSYPSSVGHGLGDDGQGNVVLGNPGKRLILKNVTEVGLELLSGWLWNYTPVRIQGASSLMRLRPDPVPSGCLIRTGGRGAAMPLVV